MTKIKAGNIEKGMFLIHFSQPHQVVAKKFVSPARGAAFNRTKLKNLKTGGYVEHVFKSHETVERIEVESKKMQFLYKNDDQLVFMDPHSYEQVDVEAQVLGDKVDYLVPELEVYIMFYQDKALAVNLPAKVTMEVKKAPQAVAGDRSNAGTKAVTMETGLVVQAPLFIEPGEKLIIDTDQGEYISRA